MKSFNDLGMSINCLEDEMATEWKEIVESSGYKVGVDSDECAIYTTQHSKCVGCEYEVGCGKYVALGINALSILLYKPTDFNDHLTMSKHVRKITKMIMDAKTPEELKAIPL